MIFNSFTFVVFFIIVFVVYWILLKERTKSQNVFLLLASWFFYGYADVKMLPLLVVSIVIFFYLGRWIHNAESEKTSSVLTTLGVLLGVGLLLYFKYFNFFIESFINLFASIGLHSNIHTFNIIMPLGISFYTFRLLSYLIDIHRGKCNPTDNFISFATYISFFPCLLSGPIDRPKFIGQIESKRVFDYDKAVDGCRQILWGLFKKVVVADNCAVYVDSVWGNIGGQTGSTLLLSAILYSFQMYADFSGYSDMAIGVGKLLGFNISQNFNYPFFALNVADYWRRWHMSLTSWLTDYVFMPLNIKFRDLGTFGLILAIVINMVVVGMWHGANWTYAVFGLYHGLLFVPLIISGTFHKKTKIKTNKIGLPVFGDMLKMICTFLLVTLGLVIFRAESITQAGEYVCEMWQWETLQASYRFFTQEDVLKISWSCVLLLTIEWVQRSKRHGLEANDNQRLFWLRIVGYYLLCMLIIINIGQEQFFIYAQF